MVLELVLEDGRMSDLDEAAKMLDLAVQRLEEASQRAEAKPAVKAVSPGLAEATAAVAAKLEEAILRIDRLLEE
jgi:hypothetical protein